MAHKKISLFLVIFLIVALGMASTIVPWATKPFNRHSIGLQGYSDDYVGYVSIIKEGIYGRNSYLIRSNPVPQSFTPIHLSYIALGKIAKIFNLDAITTYHLARVFLAGVFVYLTYKLFLKLLNDHNMSLLATLIAFFSSALSYPSLFGNSWTVKVFNFFNFSLVSPEKATDRPHYLLGASLFLLVITRLLNIKQKTNQLELLIIAVTSFFLAIVHTSFSLLLMSITFAVLIWQKLSGKTFKLDKNDLRNLAIIVPQILGLAVIYLSIKRYSQANMIWFDSFYYSQNVSFVGMIKDFISFGPTAILGYLGYFWYLLRKKQDRNTFVMFLWITIQLLFFFFLYRFFRSDRVRFIQSLYFIPFSYGTVLFIKYFMQKINKKLTTLSLIFILIISLPTFVSDLIKSISDSTNQDQYSIFLFPTQKQLEAYAFLDKNTAKESTVLAYFEGANHILLYSHNRVLGNAAGWPQKEGLEMLAKRDEFLRGKMPVDKSWQYLKLNQIDFIYYGYQEKSLGDITKYPFLKQIFQNSEAAIYQVL